LQNQDKTDRSPWTIAEGVPRIARKSFNRSAVAAYGCICLALVLLFGLSVWSTLLQAEVARLRSHAERTVGRLERDLEAQEYSADQQSRFLRQRAILLGSVSLIVLLAAAALYYIATHSIFLRRAVSSAHLERNAEISRLAAGLAHEIRNPLYAIRLNLHTFQRSQREGSELEPDEMKRMLEQSGREIDRIDQLMRELVGFATPEEPRDEVIDLTSELQGIVDFIDQEMVRSGVEVSTELPRRGVLVRFDSGRLRQIMLNLLQNAADASQANGRVAVVVKVRSGNAEITVTDNGRGVLDADRKRIFEPFFTTKSDGTGLGLALVKRFVEQADGEIHCENNPIGGTIFRIRLHEHSRPQEKRR
jgi:signal transduction histidine kinase